MNRETELCGRGAAGLFFGNRTALGQPDLQLGEYGKKEFYFLG
jgi:hypothetical protein